MLSSQESSRSDQFIIWDFDGTLAYREGMWSQAVVDVVNRNFAELNLVSSDVSKYLPSGFFWHTPDTAHLHVVYAALSRCAKLSVSCRVNVRVTSG